MKENAHKQDVSLIITKKNKKMKVTFEGGTEVVLTPDQIIGIAEITSTRSTYEMRKGFVTKVDEGLMFRMLGGDKKALSMEYTYVCENTGVISFHYVDGVLVAASIGVHFITYRRSPYRCDASTAAADAAESAVKEWLLKKIGATAKTVAEEADMAFRSHDAIDHIPIG